MHPDCKRGLYVYLEEKEGVGRRRKAACGYRSRKALGRGTASAGPEVAASVLRGPGHREDQEEYREVTRGQFILAHAVLGKILLLF